MHSSHPVPPTVGPVVGPGSVRISIPSTCAFDESLVAEKLGPGFEVGSWPEPDVIVLHRPAVDVVVALCRRRPAAGVLVTGVSDDQDVVAMLHAGADDAVGFCETAEFVARIRAVERRTRAARRRLHDTDGETRRSAR